MSRGYWLLLGMIFVLLVVTGCARQLRDESTEVASDGAFRARALLSRQQQRDYDKLFLEALKQKYTDHTDAARELLAAALDINPNASEALYELGKLETSLFSAKTDSATVAQADEMLLRAYQLEPSNPYYCRTLAQRWVQVGKYARAAALYEQMTRVHPHGEDLGLLIKIYEMIPDNEAALRTVERLEQVEGADETTVLERFTILLNMGRRDAAFQLVEQMCADHPDELRYRVMLGDLYMQNGLREKAFAIYDEVLARDPDNSFVRIAMLQYHAETGDSLRFEQEMTAILRDVRVENHQKYALLKTCTQAQLGHALNVDPLTLLGFYRTALEIPQETSEVGELCLAYIEAAKLPEDSARFAYDAILRDQPEHLKARLGKLVSLVRQGDTQLLAPLCHEGRIHHPEMLIFYYYEGAALIQDDATAEGMAVLEAGVEWAAAHGEAYEDDALILSDIYQMLGDSYHAEGDRQRCYEAYEQALACNPENLVVLNNYAYFLSLDGISLEKAETMSRKVIDAEPDNATYLDTYAWVLYCLGRYPQARIYIEQTFRSLTAEERESASSASLYDHAGDIYLKCGDRKQAIEHWQKAAELTDDAALQQQLQKKLR